MIKFRINPKYEYLKEKILAIPKLFNDHGTIIQDNRNIIKIMDLDDYKINVKSFKPPHFINRIAYTYFRKSKAERSFLYAEKLERLGLATPEPIAYIIYQNGLISRSFYISIQIDVDMEYRDIVHQSPDDLEPLLKAFTRFTYELHEKGVLFLDYSPGNVLIKRLGNHTYSFNLVDLNRMKFKKLTLNQRIANFRKLMASPRMLEIMAREYAELVNADFNSVLKKMVRWTIKHNRRLPIWFVD